MCSTYNILPKIDICLHELADSDLGVISEDPWFYSVLYVLRTPTQSFRSIIPCCQLTVAPSAYQMFPSINEYCAGTLNGLIEAHQRSERRT